MTFNPEDLLDPNFWLAQGIQPVIVETPEDLSKVRGRIEEEINNIRSSDKEKKEKSE